ncbi:MAG: DUF4231 domain-containing protein [Actinobacteria bacterium]|nr:DUF4231 domain-containing protein [Actinomycetota bacterium]
MTAATDDTQLQALWDDRVRWSRAADAMKRRLDRARVAALWLSALGAVATTLSTTRLHGTASMIATIVGTVLLAGATLLGTQFLTSDATRHWVQARAVSEAIKQQVFRFRAHATPYIDGAALGRLQSEVAEIEQGAVDLSPYVPELSTPAGAPPPAMTPEMYVRERIEKQIGDYYRPRARMHAQRSRRLRLLTAVLSAAAAVVAAVSAIPVLKNAVSPWVAVLTTLGAALAVYLTSRRYDYLVVSFTATANQLQSRLNRWRADGSPTDDTSWSAFVDDCENAIAHENDSWMAKWSETKGGS